MRACSVDFSRSQLPYAKYASPREALTKPARRNGWAIEGSINLENARTRPDYSHHVEGDVRRAES